MTNWGRLLKNLVKSLKDLAYLVNILKNSTRLSFSFLSEWHPLWKKEKGNNKEIQTSLAEFLHRAIKIKLATKGFNLTNLGTRMRAIVIQINGVDILYVYGIVLRHVWNIAEVSIQGYVL